MLLLPRKIPQLHFARQPRGRHLSSGAASPSSRTTPTEAPSEVATLHTRNISVRNLNILVVLVVIHLLSGRD